MKAAIKSTQEKLQRSPPTMKI